MKIARQLDVKVVCVFDQALYAKVTEILWKDEEKMRTIIVRMGAFHTICNFLATIGKRFKDAGLRDVAVESAVMQKGQSKLYWKADSTTEQSGSTRLYMKHSKD